MILITGGLGFIGSHTTRAMLDLGESCVLVQRRAAAVPGAFAGEAGRRVFVEQADITDRPAFLEIGKRHKITGIVHLAGSVPWPPGAYEPVDGARKAIDSLLNVIQAASDWGVARVGAASTIGVYGGVAAESAVPGGHAAPDDSRPRDPGVQEDRRAAGRLSGQRYRALRSSATASAASGARSAAPHRRSSRRPSSCMRRSAASRRTSPRCTRPPTPTTGSTCAT